MRRISSWTTYSLLIDFINEFLKNGVTMRGFYSSHQSKSIMKYGVAESDVISWYAWHKACVEFMSNIFEINKKEAFSCLTFGPRPPILVIDGISMGIQQSKLTQGNSQGKSKHKWQLRDHWLQIPGSNVHQTFFKSENFARGCKKCELAKEWKTE